MPSYSRIPTQAGHPVHPTPLYDIVASGGLFLYLWRRRHDAEAKPGDQTTRMLIVTSVTRYLMEFFRDHERGRRVEKQDDSLRNSHFGIIEHDILGNHYLQIAVGGIAFGLFLRWHLSKNMWKKMVVSGGVGHCDKDIQEPARPATRASKSKVAVK